MAETPLVSLGTESLSVVIPEARLAAPWRSEAELSTVVVAPPEVVVVATTLARPPATALMPPMTVCGEVESPGTVTSVAWPTAVDSPPRPCWRVVVPVAS